MNHIIDKYMLSRREELELSLITTKFKNSK